MNTYSVMIVEDSVEQSRIIEELVSSSKIEADFVVETCASLADFEQCLKKGYTPQIVFMDVVFEDAAKGGRFEDGIEASRRLLNGRHGVQLIYVTGHAEYCTRAYRTEHVYFLLKPIEPEDFEDALEKAVCNIRARSSRPFGVKVGGRIMRVVPSEIVYIESDRRKVRIHTADDVIEAYESLGGIASKLPDTFVQCHKSFLVNMESIVELRSDGVDLVSGLTVPVSQKRSRDTRDAFMAYLLERM